MFEEFGSALVSLLIRSGDFDSVLEICELNHPLSRASLSSACEDCSLTDVFAVWEMMTNVQLTVSGR